MSITPIELREKYAGQILAGFASNPAIFASNGMNGWDLVNATHAQLANLAVQMADALVEEVFKDTP